VELRQLQYFRSVADAGNFTRAAERSLVTQPSLSRQIQLLEEEVGLKLFNRHKGGVELTEAGECLLVHVRRILDEVDRAQVSLADLQALRSGHVRIATFPALGTYLLPQVLTRFASEYPGIRVTLTTHDRLEIERQVAEGQADLGLIVHPPTQEGIVSELLLTEALLVAVHEGSFETEYDLADLADQPLITLPRGDCLREIVDQAFADRGLIPRVHLEIPDLHGIVRLVECGVGYSILPERFLQPYRASGALRTARTHGREIAVHVSAVHRRGRYRCHGSRALLDYMRAFADQALA